MALYHVIITDGQGNLSTREYMTWPFAGRAFGDCFWMEEPFEVRLEQVDETGRTIKVLAKYSSEGLT